MSHQTRYTPVEIRTDGRGRIFGYAAVYYDGTEQTQYRMCDALVERIFPPAFDRCIRERQDIWALFNHDENQILGLFEERPMRFPTI